MFIKFISKNGEIYFQQHDEWGISLTDNINDLDEDIDNTWVKDSEGFLEIFCPIRNKRINNDMRNFLKKKDIISIEIFSDLKNPKKHYEILELNKPIFNLTKKRTFIKKCIVPNVDIK